jgi:uncharacterized protein YdhG (YjbR/CyaY superfamily)
MSEVDDYLATLSEPNRAALHRIRELVLAAAPDAEEGRSYGMPAFKVRGKPVLGFQAAKEHLSVYPFSPATIEAVRERLEGFDAAKGTIRFTAERPLTDDIVTALVQARLTEILENPRR